jgi:hypothetical protein
VREVKRHMLRTVCLFSLAIILCPLGTAGAAGPVPATLLVNDSLSSPNQTVMVEARLMSRGPAAPAGLGGEPLELLVYG